MALPVPVVLLQPLGPNGPSIDSQGGSNRKKEGNASHVINSSLNMIFIVISYVKLQSKASVALFVTSCLLDKMLSIIVTPSTSVVDFSTITN